MSLSRRTLLGAVVASFTLRPVFAAELPADMVKQPGLDGWIRVDPPGTITVFTGKAELGQGIHTALSQIVADVMDVAFGRIAIVGPDTSRTPDEGQTSGSQSVEYGGEALRVAAAEARAVLIAAAAMSGNVPAARLTVLDGIVSDPDTAWSTTYWQVVTEGMLHRPAAGDVPQKPASAYAVIGQSVPRIDIPPKVRGGAIYVQDMRLPGMLHGRVVRPPSYAATLTGSDEAPVRAMPGVVAVVRSGSFLGVLAEREEQAIAARNALLLAATWSEHAHPAGPGGAARNAACRPRPAVRDQRQGRRHAPLRAAIRGGIHPALHRPRLDRPVLRRGPAGRRHDARVEPYPGRVPAADQPVQHARDAVGPGGRHPCPGQRLLRP